MQICETGVGNRRLAIAEEADAARPTRQEGPAVAARIENEEACGCRIEAGSHFAVTEAGWHPGQSFGVRFYCVVDLGIVAPTPCPRERQLPRFAS